MPTTQVFKPVSDENTFLGTQFCDNCCGVATFPRLKRCTKISFRSHLRTGLFEKNAYYKK